MGQKDFSRSVKEANSQHVNNIDINTQKKMGNECIADAKRSK